MEIHVIGVGEAFDSKRPNSSSVIGTEDYRLLIDCGSSVPPLLWDAYSEPDALDAIYFTHLHPDHCFGLGPMLIWWMDEGRKKPLRIYTTESGRKRLEALIDLALWGKTAPVFSIEWHEIRQTQMIGPFQAHFAKTTHDVVNFAVRLEHDGTSFFYSGDGAASPASKELMRKVDLCFHECYSQNRHSAHYDLASCLKMVDELEIADLRLYHLSVKDFPTIRDSVSSHPRIQLAERGERIRIR